ncbi:DNA-3-methyladenine glycosylase 2 family protein [Microbacterium sp. 4R-513]|uniref:DNA-3-methyladenine glycosylase family protein n=1 Tax=Microbacterium sp. 4R-513 TaxID=2567934 RepID=UPI0019D00407|nr:DNA-3-methyladenine glycosylase 2 family protein [Microbacterium sp. 4R-513]
MTETIALPRPAGYSLAAASRFVMAFPAGEGGDDTGRLDLAFALDRTWRPVAVRVSQREDALEAEVVHDPSGAGVQAIRHDLVRILNLDVLDDPFAEIGARDPLIAQLRTRYPGLRPVQFPTPWEAAAWTIIGRRIRMTQAAAIKRRIAEQHGERFRFPDGGELAAFPGPEAILSAETLPGLTGQKLGALHLVAEAAASGSLDSDRLAAAPVAEALESLQTIPGIGPFSAELILVRGVRQSDVLPAHEPRLARAMATLYGTDDPAEHARIAEAWRPYRSWVSFLLRRWLEDETGEIARGRPAPSPDRTA